MLLHTPALGPPAAFTRTGKGRAEVDVDLDATSGDRIYGKQVGINMPWSKCGMLGMVWSSHNH